MVGIVVGLDELFAIAEGLRVVSRVHHGQDRLLRFRGLLGKLDFAINNKKRKETEEGLCDAWKNDIT